MIINKNFYVIKEKQDNIIIEITQRKNMFSMNNNGESKKDVSI